MRNQPVFVSGSGARDTFISARPANTLGLLTSITMVERKTLRSDFRVIILVKNLDAL